MRRDLLSIVIVNFNGENFLPDCIKSIHENCADIAFEIIVVDNNSNDNSVELIKKRFPEVNLIENHENHGFAKGNNIGVRQSNGNFILLLNNDTILLDPLFPALNLFKNDSSIGIVGIKMLDEQNRFIASFGKFPKFYNFLKLKTLQIDLSKIERKISASQNQYIDVNWISGTFLITTKEIWTQVRGLDESYFMYVEDVDFNKKVSILKKKSIFLPTQRFIHFGGFNKSRENLLRSSYKTYIRKHKKGIDLRVSLLMLNINIFIKNILNWVQ